MRCTTFPLQGAGCSYACSDSSVAVRTVGCAAVSVERMCCHCREHLFGRHLLMALTSSAKRCKRNDSDAAEGLVYSKSALQATGLALPARQLRPSPSSRAARCRRVMELCRQKGSADTPSSALLRCLSTRRPTRPPQTRSPCCKCSRPVTGKVYLLCASPTSPNCLAGRRSPPTPAAAGCSRRSTARC